MSDMHADKLLCSVLIAVCLVTCAVLLALLELTSGPFAVGCSFNEFASSIKFLYIFCTIYLSLIEYSLVSDN